MAKQSEEAQESSRLLSSLPSNPSYVLTYPLCRAPVGKIVPSSHVEIRPVGNAGCNGKDCVSREPLLAPLLLLTRRQPPEALGVRYKRWIEGADLKGHLCFELQ